MKYDDGSFEKAGRRFDLIFKIVIGGIFFMVVIQFSAYVFIINKVARNPGTIANGIGKQIGSFLSEFKKGMEESKP